MPSVLATSACIFQSQALLTPPVFLSEKLSEGPPLGTPVPHLESADVWDALSVLCCMSPHRLPHTEHAQACSFNRRLEGCCVSLVPTFALWDGSVLPHGGRCLPALASHAQSSSHSSGSPLGSPAIPATPPAWAQASPLFL